MSKGRGFYHMVVSREGVMTKLLTWDDIQEILKLAKHKQEFIDQGSCVPPPIGCGKHISQFRDQKSWEEYLLSGMCQKCQDEFFNNHSEEN